MNIDYIEDFIKVARCQSLNNASSQLNISTPALSKRIKQVEEYFECDLFYRTSKGIFLTKKGEILLDKIIFMKKELEDLKTQISESTNTTIRMGLLPSFSLYKLENSQKNFLNDDIQIKIENNTQVLLEHLHNGDIDIMIGDITSTESKKLFFKNLYSEEYMVVFPRNNKLNGNNSINVNRLINNKIFVLNPPCDTLAFIKKNLADLRLDIEYKSNLESIFASVKTNQGITIIPYSLTTRVESMDLLFKPLEEYKREVGLIAYSKNLVNQVFENISDIN